MLSSAVVSDSFRDVAVAAARQAGALLHARLGAVHRVSLKGSPVNLVTEMDRAAEALIIEAIRSRFPDHAILAEESGHLDGERDHRWIVDPLDGTTNYAHGLPLYGVSIALEIDGRPALGVIYDPSRDECFVAERGRGASLNGTPIHASGSAHLSESLLCTGYGYDIRETRDNNLAEHAALAMLCQSVRETGSAVLNLAAVAAGRLDAYWELRLRPWDVAAGMLLVEEAGGRVTDPAGRPVDLAAPALVASNGLIHDEILQTLEEARRA
jgi:myo-inositol-1(or 4)-monophosphatase